MKAQKATAPAAIRTHWSINPAPPLALVVVPTLAVVVVVPTLAVMVVVPALVVVSVVVVVVVVVLFEMEAAQIVRKRS